MELRENDFAYVYDTRLFYFLYRDKGIKPIIVARNRFDEGIFCQFYINDRLIEALEEFYRAEMKRKKLLARNEMGK